MGSGEHRYQLRVTWSGATRGYESYSRNHTIAIAGKPVIKASSDAAFRGDPGLVTPEDMLLASLSSCHMLWYLHLCAVKGVVVTAYKDEAEATMVEGPGGGRFTGVLLRPVVTITPGSDETLARTLHERAHAECFIANSVNFPVRHEPVIKHAG